MGVAVLPAASGTHRRPVAGRLTTTPDRRELDRADPAPDRARLGSRRDGRAISDPRRGLAVGHPEGKTKPAPRPDLPDPALAQPPDPGRPADGGGHDLRHRPRGRRRTTTGTGTADLP